MKFINLDKYWVMRITGTHDAYEFGRGIEAANKLNITYEFEDKITYTDAFKETLKLIIEIEDFYELANKLYADLAGTFDNETRRFAATLVFFHVGRLGIVREFTNEELLIGINVFQRLFEHEIKVKFTELEIPKEFECSRCGYCCKHFGAELSFESDDIQMWFDAGLSWVYYHPFIDWYLQEFLSPDNGVYNVENVKDARELLAEKELEYENDRRIEFSEFGLDEEFGEEVIDWKPKPFPWGGTLKYCTFLKWMGNKWGCLIHEYKSKTCREYLCYWDRMKAFFSDRQAHPPYTPVFFRLDE